MSVRFGSDNYDSNRYCKGDERSARSLTSERLERRKTHAPKEKIHPRQEPATTIILRNILSVCRRVHRTSGDASFDDRRHDGAGTPLSHRNNQNQSTHEDQPQAVCKAAAFTPLAAHRPEVSLLELLEVRRLWALWHRETAEELQSTLSSILAGVVDVLSVIPEASVDGLGSDGDGA